LEEDTLLGFIPLNPPWEGKLLSVDWSVSLFLKAIVYRPLEKDTL
jgi:hypothetical protein